MSALEILEKQLNNINRRNRKLTSGIRFTESGVIQVSQDIIDKFQLGKENGLDFVFGHNELFIAVVPISEKPLLFATKKMLQSRTKNSDGTISLGTKDKINGKQKRPEVFHEFTSDSRYNLPLDTRVKSFDIKLTDLLNDKTSPVYALFKKGKKAIERSNFDIYGFVITNTTYKSEER